MWEVNKTGRPWTNSHPCQCWGPGSEAGQAPAPRSRGCSAHSSRRRRGGPQQSLAAGCLPGKTQGKEEESCDQVGLDRTGPDPDTGHSWENKQANSDKEWREEWKCGGLGEDRV